MKSAIFNRIAMLAAACLVAAAPVSSYAKSAKKLGIVAHRGYWNCEDGGFARNSMASLKSAQKAGFWGSEFDVNITSDGQVIVVHDGKIGGKVIAENPYSAFAEMTLENGEHIPTLEQFLAQGKKCRGTMLICELKSQPSPEIEDRLLDTVVRKLKEYGLYTPKRVLFISFSRHISDRIAAEMPEFTNQYLGSEYSPENLAETKINGIDFHYSVFTKHPDWYAQARKAGMSVNCWTVNKEEDMKAMLRLGVDYITTDKPDLLREVLGTEKVKEDK